MKKMLLLSAALLAATSMPAMAASDNFNRPDGSLGSNWVPYGSGNEYIVSHKLQGDSLALDAFTPSSGDTKVTAKVFLNGTDLQYGAVASGDIASGNNAFAKIQSENGDGLFEYGALYVGNNGGGSFFALNTPVSSPAKITLSMCGTIGTLKIHSAEGTQQYQYDYGTTFGTGGGLGTYGAIALDNYRSSPGHCADSVGAIKATKVNGSTARDLSLSK